jgi:hypothetical protein
MITFFERSFFFPQFPLFFVFLLIFLIVSNNNVVKHNKYKAVVLFLVRGYDARLSRYNFR